MVLAVGVGGFAVGGDDWMRSASATRACGGLRIVHHHAAPIRGRIELGVCERVTTACDEPLDEA